MTKERESLLINIIIIVESQCLFKSIFNLWNTVCHEYKKILPWVFAVGSATTNLNAQNSSEQIRDWNINTDIIKVFWTGLHSSPWESWWYEEAIHTKEIICWTDTVTISVIGYSKRPEIEIKATPGSLEKFHRKRDWNIDAKQILSELFELKKEEDTDTYYYCPQPL